MGDFILTIPAFKALKTKIPESELSVIGPYSYLGLIKNFADHVIPIESSNIYSLFNENFEFNESLRIFLRKFDKIVTWHWDKEGVFLKNLRRLTDSLIITGSPTPLKREHQVKNLLRPIRKLGITPEEIIPEVEIDEQISNKKNRILAIHPGSGSFHKSWPGEYFKKVIDHFLPHLPIYLILGEAEMNYRYSVFFKYRNKVKFLVNLPLTELAMRMKEANLFLGNDSGISHLAASLGINTLVIFKSTDPKIWAPLGENVEIISSFPNKPWPKPEKIIFHIERTLHRN